MTILERGVAIDTTRTSLVEHGRYVVRVTAPCEPRLRIASASMEPRTVRESAGRVAAEWDLPIEFCAGEIELLVEAGAETRFLRLDVAPAPDKLGRDEHRELLEDLERRVAGIVVGALPGSARFEQEDGDDLPLLVRYAEFRARIDALDRAFATMARSPHRALMAAREDRPLVRVRVADARTVRSLLRRPRARLALLGEGPGAARVDHRRHLETFDTPANRLLRGLLVRLRAAADDLASRLDRWAAGAGPGGESRDVRERGAAYAADARAWVGRIRRMDDAWFLRDVRPSGCGAMALQTVACHPAYRRFDRVARSVLAPHRRLRWAGLPVTTRSTFELFELWCLFAVAQALTSRHPDSVWTDFREFVVTGLLVDVGGRRAMTARLPSGESIELWYQPTFGSWRPDAPVAESRTISVELRPDFVVVRRAADERLVSFQVLDAKYRASADGVRQALRDLHVYRDALRCEGRRCDSAVALVPRVAVEVARFADTAYFRAEAFGVVVVRPGSDGARLGEVLG